MEIREDRLALKYRGSEFAKRARRRSDSQREKHVFDDQKSGNAHEQFHRPFTDTVKAKGRSEGSER